MAIRGLEIAFVRKHKDDRPYLLRRPPYAGARASEKVESSSCSLLEERDSVGGVYTSLWLSGLIFRA